jgi:hypothetical protein
LLKHYIRMNGALRSGNMWVTLTIWRIIRVPRKLRLKCHKFHDIRIKKMKRKWRTWPEIKVTVNINLFSELHLQWLKSLLTKHRKLSIGLDVYTKQSL